AADPEIEAALAETGESVPDADVTPSAREILGEIDVAYYEGDAVEMTSRQLNKADGVAAAFDVLDLEDPFALVLGDSKSDLRIMRWLEETDSGIAAAPSHASEQVLEFVSSTDDLVFDRGAADQILRTLRAMAEFDDVVGS
ncbi:MAG: HAD family hydrolase, partial [Halanaeroarchaeum sp.]